MVTFNDLLSWSGTDLNTAGEALVAASHKYEQVNADLKKDGLSDGLSGKTFEAEAKARRILADDAEDLWTGLSKAGNDLIEAASTVTDIWNAAWFLKAKVEAKDYRIASSKNKVLEGSTDFEVGEPYQPELTNLIEQATDAIAFISATYDSIAALDDTANGPSPEVVNHGERPPNPNWTPNQVNDWWTSLTDAQRQNIISKHPAWIGNLDGIPSKDRHEANMIWLPIIKREIDQQVKDCEPKTTQVWHSTTTGTGYYEEVIDPYYKELLKKQEDINSLYTMYFDDKGERKDAGGRTLLVLDNSGHHLQAAIGSGDIDHADNVIVYTPGMNSKVGGNLVIGSGLPGKDVNATENIMKESGLQKPTKDNKEEETVAGVTWLNYDAPDDVTVLSSSAAQEGGKKLNSFYEGLQATHQGDPHLMAAGHSYGSLVNGYALQESASNPVDDLSVWGSPGIGTTDASDLNMLPDHMYSTTAKDDWPTARSGYYGGTPLLSGTAGPDSDFTALNTDAHGANSSHGPLTGSSGHSQYIPKDDPSKNPQATTCLHNQGQILRGDSPDYVNDYAINTN